MKFLLLSILLTQNSFASFTKCPDLKSRTKIGFVHRPDENEPGSYLRFKIEQSQNLNERTVKLYEGIFRPRSMFVKFSYSDSGVLHPGNAIGKCYIENGVKKISFLRPLPGYSYDELTIIQNEIVTVNSKKHSVTTFRFYGNGPISTVGVPF